LNINLTGGAFPFVYTANGTIPAGSDNHYVDPCVGGSYIDCSYSVNSICVATIDAPVNPSTYAC
jgi:hypothetical protein